MKQLLKLSWLLASLVLVSCSKTHPPAAETLGYDTVSQQTTQSFNRIVVVGNINLNINTGTHKQQVLLAGNSTDLQKVSIKVFDDKLFIQVKAGYPKVKPITATINSRYLNGITFSGLGNIHAQRLESPVLDLIVNNNGVVVIDGRIGLRKLVVNGNGVVTLNGIDSRDLYIIMHGNPKLMLSGKASLKRLNAAGNGWLSLNWINSQELTVHASGKSYIQLAGIANKFYLNLYDQARFNGKYLRADKVYVRTYGSSYAEIQGLKSQTALASDNSNIYFYGVPKFKAHFMAVNGSVLDAQQSW